MIEGCADARHPLPEGVVDRRRAAVIGRILCALDRHRWVGAPGDPMVFVRSRRLGYALAALHMTGRCARCGRSVFR